MKRISEQALLAEVTNLKTSNAFVSFIYTTEVKLRKNSEFAKGSVTKVTEIKNAQIGFNYQNAVNNHLKAQGSDANFEAEKLPYGFWLIPNLVLDNGKGTKQLRYYYVANTTSDTTYYVDGKEATAAQTAAIKALLPTKVPSGTQSAVGLNQRQVKPQNITIANIISLKINGKEL